jgi:peroxiredoxin
MRSPIFLLLAAAACAQAPFNLQNLQRAGEALIADRFKRVDLNGDGKLTAEEAKPVEFFVKGADADGDGFYTLAEVLAHMQKQVAQGTLPIPTGDTIAALVTPELSERFKAFDQNGDGKLQGEELAQARWLLRADADGDGAVTLAEVQQSFARLAGGEEAPTGSTPPPYVPEDKAPRQGPRLLKPADAGIGRMIPDVSFTDLDGKSHKLSDFTRGPATVLALISPSCPVSKRYLPTLAAAEAEAKAHGMAILLIAPSDPPEALRTALREAKVTAPCVPDPTGTLCQLLGATETTDAFVLDRARTLVYRGAVDDQYGLGYSLDAPRRRYVVEAVQAILAGKVPAVQATAAPGCTLDFTKAQPVTSEVTYHNRISRILQNHCLECHRSGGVAPFALETPEQVAAKAGMIRRMVERGAMPPWFAAPPAPGAHNPWANDRSLAERDRADLLAWLAGGRPLGDPKDAPLPRQWPAEWAIGKPDAIYQIPTPIAVKATGTMPYQNVTIETGLAEDRWVEAYEVQPTAREVVHHVLIFVRTPGGRGQGNAAPRFNPDDATGGFFAAYVPGNDHVSFPPGFAKALPAGSRIHFQIHYTPNGVATQDQVRIGVRFAKAPPQNVVQVAGIADIRLNIPPGATNHAETASIPVPRDVRLLGFMPHMHVRGKAFRYDVILPSGETRTLLEVPRYDFNWQLAYRYAEPPLIPAGSKVRATGWFDNSAGNPANPDPTKTVRWGEQTHDEMMLGYVEYYLPGAGTETAAR